jgi:hypothetical protein
MRPAEGSNGEGATGQGSSAWGLPWRGGGSLAAQLRAARRTEGARAPPFRGGQGLPLLQGSPGHLLGQHARPRRCWRVKTGWRRWRTACRRVDDRILGGD